MRIAIVSDVHGNIEALTSIPGRYDELWVLGDLVDYGPNPAEVVDYVRSHATVVIRGNHDEAAGSNVDPECSPEYREMARATLAYTRQVLTGEQLQYLRTLPLMAERVVDDIRFLLCHAAPSDPLHKYIRNGTQKWQREVDRVKADFVLVGHTHLPFVERFGNTIVVNPGSLGQPKHGNAKASYAVWDGGVELQSFEYPVERTIAKIERMPIPPRLRHNLASILKTGGAALPV